MQLYSSAFLRCSCIQLRSYVNLGDNVMTLLPKFLDRIQSQLSAHLNRLIEYCIVFKVNIIWQEFDLGDRNSGIMLTYGVTGVMTEGGI